MPRPSRSSSGRYEIHRRLLGDDHPDTANSYDGLANNLREQGEYTRAHPLYEKALAINRRLLSDDDESIGTSYHNLAINLTAQGEYAEAQPLLEKALEIQRRLLREDHAHRQGLQQPGVEPHGDKGSMREAQPLYEKALGDLSAAAASRQPDIAWAHGSGVQPQATGEGASSAALREGAGDLRRLFGDDHPHRHRLQTTGPTSTPRGGASRLSYFTRKHWRSAAACSLTTIP